VALTACKDSKHYCGCVDDQTQALMACLNNQREHVLEIVDGLSEEQLRTVKMPSDWNLVELVRHLALDVEHYWFRCITAGEPLSFFPTNPESKKGEWWVDPNVSAQDVLDLYRSEIEKSDAIIEATPLDAAPAFRDPWWGEWDVPDLRFILLHVIAETACHAGHLDATRELIDGRQYVVLG
jgi:hypothetical protein